MDSGFVDKIVNEVKAQGVFDQFRRECMSDCDTKPAYQNLRQRVENSVSRFLSDQKWKPEMNKNHLREKLRKHIADGRFLEIGVERIVDQVVLPKISTTFQPKIEDIVYKYLGIEKHESKYEDEKMDLHNHYQNGSLIIKTDLLPTEHLEEVSPDSDKSNIKISIKEEDDDESPPFEPLDSVKPPNENSLSGLSGLASQSSADTKKENLINHEGDKQINISASDITQESQLSEVSSNSRLSIDEDDDEPVPKNEMEKPKVDICEEAQMPKFHDNSNSCPPMSTDSLHFDIKKDEIKFLGTDRNIEYESMKSEDAESPVPPPPPPLETECIPPPPSYKTENIYDDGSEKTLHIVEDTQTKDEADLQNNPNHEYDCNESVGKFEAIEEKNSNCMESTQKHVLIENENVPDPSLLKMELNNDYIDKKSQCEINNERSSPTCSCNAPKNIPESKKNLSGNRHFTSYRKHSRDKKTDKQRENDKYRSGCKNSSNEFKKTSSSDKYSNNSRNSSQLSSKICGKDQKISHKDITSLNHHKSKNEKYSGESRDKSRSERDKKSYRNRSIDDHSSSRNKYSRKRSTDSEEGDTKKLNSDNRKNSNKSVSNSSIQETEISTQKKYRNYEKDAGDVLANDLEKIEFVLGIRGSESKFITEEKKSYKENEKIIPIKSEEKIIENHMSLQSVYNNVNTSKQSESNNEVIIPQEPSASDTGYTSENEKDLKYFEITSEEKNEYKTLVKTFEEHLNSYHMNDNWNQNIKKIESLKRKLSSDCFEKKYTCTSSSEFVENTEKKAKTDIKNDRNVENTCPTQEQTISDSNLPKSDRFLE